MADKFKILARENRRGFIIFDVDYWEICRELADPLVAHESAILGREAERASKAICQAAASFLAYLEQKTEFVVNGEAFDTEERMAEVDRARRGEDSGRLWWKASYSEIGEKGLVQQYGRSTVVAGIKYTIALGLVERRNSERTERKTNEPKAYRLLADRLDLAIRLVRRGEIASAWTFPEPTVSQESSAPAGGSVPLKGVPEAIQGVPEATGGMPETAPGMPKADAGIPEVDDAVAPGGEGPYLREPDPRPPGDRQDPSASQPSVPTQMGAESSTAPTCTADDSPIYGETNDQLGAVGEQESPSPQTVDALADQLCRQLADLFSARTGVTVEPDESWVESARRVIDRHSRPEDLPQLIAFTQQSGWWPRRITDMGDFERNLVAIASDFHAGPKGPDLKAVSGDFDQDVL